MTARSKMPGRSLSPAHRATAIDLFAGCGGFSVGLIAAGYRVLAGIDSYPRCIWTFDHNHAKYKSVAIKRDLRAATGADLLADVGVSHVDLVCGGPPCQSFSIRGKRRGIDDARGSLAFDFARLVGEVKPTAFIFENVANLASKPMARILSQLVERFESHGYKCTLDVLLAADYGVAQNRKRLFIIGSLRRQLRFPPPTHSQKPERGRFRHVTVSDVLNDIPDVGLRGSRRFQNHEDTAHTPSMLAAFRRLKPGKRDAKSHHDRLHPDRPGYTLRAGTGNFTPLRPIHHKYDRVISVRESARLQGFPDDFVWPPTVPRLQQYRQVGNAVPPPLAAVISRAVGQQLGFALIPVSVAFPGLDLWVRWDTDERKQLPLFATGPS